LRGRVLYGPRRAGENSGAGGDDEAVGTEGTEDATSEFTIAGAVEIDDAVESEAGACEHPTDLREGEDVEVHAGNVTVVFEDLVADLVALEGHDEMGLEQPEEALGVEEVEPAIVDVKDEEASRLEDAVDLSEDVGAVEPAPDESEGAEHAEDGVEGGGGQA